MKDILDSVKPPSAKHISMRITPSAQKQLRRGHPWLFDNSITEQSHDGASGDLAVVYDKKNKFLAIGIYDPHSPLRVRLLGHRKPVKISRDWFLKNIRGAVGIRKQLTTIHTNGFRIIHGENDGLPGLVADYYAGTVVIKIYTPAWVPHLSDILHGLIETLSVERIILRLSRTCSKRPELIKGLMNGQLLYGPAIDKTIVFKENGINFKVDPVNGQKTGFFLDQRENRSRVEKLAFGKDVLNVFSYTGGFSLYAARGGAKSVTSLDSSKQAIEGLKANLLINAKIKRISACANAYIIDDAFKAMKRLEIDKKSFDVVIIDPPSFAKRQNEIEAALTAYSKLVSLGLNILRKSGLLVMASCSTHVSTDDFFNTVFSAAQNQGRPLKEVDRSRHALDHPITFPEGSYLKCLFATG